VAINLVVNFGYKKCKTMDTTADSKIRTKSGVLLQFWSAGSKADADLANNILFPSLKRVIPKIFLLIDKTRPSIDLSRLLPLLLSKSCWGTYEKSFQSFIHFSRCTRVDLWRRGWDGQAALMQSKDFQ